MGFLDRLAALIAPPAPEDPIARMVEEITDFLLASSHTWPSVQGIDRERWARNLLADGITHVPRHPLLAETHADVQVSNRLSEMIHDAARARARKDHDRWAEKVHALQAHEIRDLRAMTDPLARRPYKRSKPRHYVNGQLILD